MWSFSGQLCVCSLRTPAPSEEYKAMLASLLQSQDDRTPQISAMGRRTNGQRRARQLEEARSGETDGRAGQGKEESEAGQLTKSEARRLRRERRRKEVANITFLV